MPKNTYRVIGKQIYNPGRLLIEADINVLADNAEQAIKKARKHFLGDPWEDALATGKNKGKVVVRKCTEYHLESVNRVASAEI